MPPQKKTEPAITVPHYLLHAQASQALKHNPQTPGANLKKPTSNKTSLNLRICNDQKPRKKNSHLRRLFASKTPVKTLERPKKSPVLNPLGQTVKHHKQLVPEAQTSKKHRQPTSHKLR